MKTNTFFLIQIHTIRQAVCFMVLMFGVNLMNAQVAYYEFSQAQKAFTLLENPTVLATVTGASGAESLDDVVYSIPDNTIPFSFNFKDTDYTGLKVFTNGYVTFGNTETIKNRPISENTPYSGVVSAMATDLNGLFQINGKTARISYKTIGTAPNRSFVIEYLHFRPYSSSTSNSSYFDWSFQIHLNENQSIEIVYDLQVTGTPSSDLVEVGLRGSTNADFNSRKANGVASSNWTSTTASTQNTDRITTNSSTLPPSGYTFKWEKTNFCLPVYQYSADPVTRVIFNTIDNVSTSTVPTTPVYEDFTNISTDLTKGQTYPISIKGPSSTFPSDVMVYIDFNQNGLFDDAGESFYIGRLEPQNPFNALTITSDIHIPTTALTGPTKMRIVKNTNVSALANPDAPNAVSGPCATNMRSGQVEEYTLNLQGTSTAPAVQTVVVTTQNNAPAQISALNGTLPLVATINPAGANQDVTWSVVSGQTFVSVNNEGIVTGIANGTSTVRATSIADAAKFGEIQVTVNQPLSVESVTVTTINNAEAKIIVQNGTLPLVATVNPSGVSQDVTWSVVAGASFAGVSTTGVVTGITNGTAIIRGTSVADTTKFGEIEVMVDIPTASIDDFVRKHIKVYPNPAVDVLNFTSDLTLESIEIYDMTGKKVIETKQTQINIQHIASGIYQVKIMFENQKTGCIKIIKK